MQMNMDKLNNAIKFDADDEIEYIPLGYNEYRVILPLKKDYCIQLGLGSSVQLDISFEEDPVEAEDDFREMIENQFYSEYYRRGARFRSRCGRRARRNYRRDVGDAN